MPTDELGALAALTFNWTRTLNDVWAPAPFHVEGLHAEVSQDITRAIGEAATGPANPLGIVIQGQRGVGKTHLLGWAREQVQAAGGYFFLVGDLSAKAFWEELLGCVVEQLLPLPDGSRDQLRALLDKLAERVGLDSLVPRGDDPPYPPNIRDAVTGRVRPDPDALKAFIRQLRRVDPSIGLICQDTARALVLLASPDQDDQDVGYYFMTGNEVNLDDRRRWGIHATRSVPRLLITELSRLLALTGPTVIAIDQIDALIDELVGTEARAEFVAEGHIGGYGGSSPRETGSDAGPIESRFLRSAPRPIQARGLADMATGLMTLRDRSFRTLTIVSSLPESWNAIRDYGTDSVTDRFRSPRQLANIPSAEIGRLMIAKRFGAEYARAGFTPPYPTWPIRPEAFDGAGRYSARGLLKRVEAHVAACLQSRCVTELSSLDADAATSAVPVAAASSTRPTADPLSGLHLPPDDGTADQKLADPEFADLDARFAALRADPEVLARAAAALDPKTEDTVMPALLDAGFEAWVRELGAGADHPFAQDPPPGKNPRLHASLRLVLDPRTERHRRWAFRAIAAPNANAVQSRLRKAAEAAGLDAGRSDRHLFVLRNGGWPTGKVTERETAAFEEKGGIVLPATSEDLVVFAALAQLTARAHPALNAWLADRRPAHATELLTVALWDASVPEPGPLSSSPLLSSPASVPTVEHPLPARTAPARTATGRTAPVWPTTTRTTTGGVPWWSVLLPDGPTSSTSAWAVPLEDSLATFGSASDVSAFGASASGVSVEEAGEAAAEEATAEEASAWDEETLTLGASTEAAQATELSALAVRVGLPAAGIAGAALDLASLRRHVAVFAGTGSGKTALLRRIIEECALQGVSSIVLDPNNDLARLGDPWPAAPDPWLAGDPERAATYLAETDVVIWTPRREGGRPLTFRPLPDFGAVLDEVDEFNAAVDAAVEALAPRIGLARQSGRAPQEKAVLTEAMRYFARGAGRDLGVFIDILASLPEHVSTQTRATQIAADLADRLRAVRATDPLFGGAGLVGIDAGEIADPEMLLTPPPGKRARVSVISRVGMASLDQWQSFVNQLQMALFSWVKRNPAEDKPLAGLLVMDEAQDLVPAVGTTACSESTRRLASQARKYGLGLLFATQSPKALHNSIPGNAVTQFFGLLSAPAQISAARDFARAKGGDVPAVGRLSAGEFYLTTEGTGFRRIHTPFCLSHHPDGPLAEEEVLARAAAAHAGSFLRNCGPGHVRFAGVYRVCRQPRPWGRCGVPGRRIAHTRPSACGRPLGDALSGRGAGSACARDAWCFSKTKACFLLYENFVRFH
jgi:hypothetical protein